MTCTTEMYCDRCEDRGWYLVEDYDGLVRRVKCRYCRLDAVRSFWAVEDYDGWEHDYCPEPSVADELADRIEEYLAEGRRRFYVMPISYY